jgi:hypothetical protein
MFLLLVGVENAAIHFGEYPAAAARHLTQYRKISCNVYPDHAQRHNHPGDMAEKSMVSLMRARRICSETRATPAARRP